MGITESIKLLNENKESMDAKVEGILNEYVKLQEDNIERLKEYL